MSKWDVKALDLLDLKRVMTRWQKDLEGKGWNSLYLSNHDQPRALSRFGDDGRYRVESAKMLATFLHMLQGTPYVYQGEEIGMTNVKFESISTIIATSNRSTCIKRVCGGEGARPPGGPADDPRQEPRQRQNSHAMGRQRERRLHQPARLGSRSTPTTRRSTSSRHSPIPNRSSHYYQKLIRLRKDNPMIVYGTYDLILESHREIYAFTRTLEDDRLLVILNFTKERACLRTSQLGSLFRQGTADRQLRGRSGRRYPPADPASL